MTLTYRTRDTLTWIADQYTVNFHHVRAVINLHPETKTPLSVKGVQSLFLRLRQQGYVEWKRLLPDRPSFVYVTKQTLDELALPYPEYEPQETLILPTGKKQNTTHLHKDHINHLRLYLEKRYGRQVGWVSERRLRLDQEPKTDGSYPHRVDALAFLEGKETGIEVEKTKKGERRLEGIMLTLMAKYEQTYYYCTNPGTYGLVKHVARDLDPEGNHFRIVDWSEIA